MGRIRDGWGRLPFQLKQQARRSRRGAPILRDHPARVGQRGNGNTWRGSCGVKLFGGAFGARKPLSTAFALASPEDQRERILGPFNIINRVYSRIPTEATKEDSDLESVAPTAPSGAKWRPSIDDALRDLPLVSSFPNFYRVYMLQHVPERAHEVENTVREELLTRCKQQDTTFILTSIGRVHEHRMLRWKSAPADGGLLTETVTGISFLSLVQVVMNELRAHHPFHIDPLRVLREESTSRNAPTLPSRFCFSDAVKWYVHNHDPRSPQRMRATPPGSPSSSLEHNAPLRFITPSLVAAVRRPGVLLVHSDRLLVPSVQNFLLKKLDFQSVRDVWLDTKSLVGPQKTLDSIARC